MKDMTSGKPLSLLLKFAIPLFFGNLFQLFYSLVDVHIVGQTLGEMSLAAVGATTPLTDLMISFLYGFTNGFSIVIATFYGAKNEKDLKRTVALSFGISMAAAILLTGGSLLFLSPTLSALNVSRELHAQAVSYAAVIIAGLIFTALYNTCSAILRGIGDSVTPLIFLILSSFLNIGLDYLFILGFHSGVAGAAYATVLSQFVSAVMCLVYMFRKYEILHIQNKDFAFSKNILKKMLSMGFSMGLMLSLVNLGTLILQSSINCFGPYIIVAHTSARKISSIFMLPTSVVGAALATFAGQNHGAGQNARIKQGLLAATKAVFLMDIVIMVIAMTLSPQIIQLLSASNRPEVIQNGSLYLKVDTLFYFLCTLVCLIRNTLQGMGNSMVPILSSVCELICKALFAFFLAPVMGYMGIIICEPIAWAIMLIPLLVCYIQVTRRPSFLINK